MLRISDLTNGRSVDVWVPDALAVGFHLQVFSDSWQKGETDFSRRLSPQLELALINSLEPCFRPVLPTLVAQVIHLATAFGEKVSVKELALQFQVEEMLQQLRLRAQK